MNQSQPPQAARAAQEASARRDFAGAERHARDWLAQRPRDPEALQFLGATLLHLQKWPEAIEPLSAASALAPNNAVILTLLGQARRRTFDREGARVLFTRASALGLMEGARQLAELETEVGDFGAAVVACERAVELAPNSAPAHAALALALEQRRLFDRAKGHAQRALALSPTSQTARIALGRIAASEGDWAGVRAALSPLLQTTVTVPTNRVLALGMIGNADDREGRVDEAFAAFNEANQIVLHQGGLQHRNTVQSPYHPETVARMARFVDGLDAAQASAWPSAERTPVFLVGFPRSGTTLLDQILASHSRVVTLEEKEIFSQTVGDLLMGDAERALRLSDEELQAYRARYWAEADASAGHDLGDRILVDKLPLNILFLPMIARIFPGARVIVALRDPRDSLLSCFQQRFVMNTAMAQFLELETGARYYDRAMELYQRSHAKLPLLWHEVRYEHLVSDLESAARGLTGFLGLPFEPAMLSFSETAKQRDIRTPSARQVSEPIYKRSVARWRRYERHLAPALPVLAPWVARFGYEA